MQNCIAFSFAPKNYYFSVSMCKSRWCGWQPKTMQRKSRRWRALATALVARGNQKRAASAPCGQPGSASRSAGSLARKGESPSEESPPHERPRAPRPDGAGVAARRSAPCRLTDSRAGRHPRRRHLRATAEPGRRRSRLARGRERQPWRGLAGESLEAHRRHRPGRPRRRRPQPSSHSPAAGRGRPVVGAGRGAQCGGAPTPLSPEDTQRSLAPLVPGACTHLPAVAQALRASPDATPSTIGRSITAVRRPTAQSAVDAAPFPARLARPRAVVTSKWGPGRMGGETAVGTAAACAHGVCTLRELGARTTLAGAQCHERRRRGAGRTLHRARGGYLFTGVPAALAPRSRSPPRPTPPSCPRGGRVPCGPNARPAPTARPRAAVAHNRTSLRALRPRSTQRQ